MRHKKSPLLESKTGKQRNNSLPESDETSSPPMRPEAIGLQLQLIGARIQGGYVSVSEGKEQLIQFLCELEAVLDSSPSRPQGQFNSVAPFSVHCEVQHGG